MTPSSSSPSQKAQPPRLWPIHDLVVTELFVWIRPTHMTTHLFRLASVLLLLWGGCLWIVLQGEEMNHLELQGQSSADHQDVSRMSFAASAVVIGATFLVSIVYTYRYYQSILYAFGKPWMSPGTPAIQRLDMHVPLRIFDDIEKARRAACLPHMVAWNVAPAFVKKEDSPLTSNVICLDNLVGPWRFQLLRTVEEGFDLVRRASNIVGGENPVDAGDWAPIQVPGNWMLQGFDDIPIYTNKKYPFPNTPPVVPRENPTGVYELEIKELPDSWNVENGNEEYTILLHGMESACFVYWNGEFLGFCKDSRLPSEFAIPSELLRDTTGGSAVLHLMVVRWSDGSYMEDQDHWWMAGLHRSVELIRRPARADIMDYRVHATMSRELKVAVDLRTTRNPPMGKHNLTVRLVEDDQHTADGDEWIRAEGELWSQTLAIETTMLGSIMSGRVVTMTFESASIPNVKLWTAETPNLYTLLVIQSDAASGETLQVESCRVGFRSIHVHNDGVLRVNGERITVCGINRHEHDPDHGKVVSLERMKQDIVILK